VFGLRKFDYSFTGNQIREEVRNLLLKPDTTIAEVTYQLGFDYSQYFSRLFKKKIGVSPKEFRDSNMVH